MLIWNVIEHRDWMCVVSKQVTLSWLYEDLRSGSTGKKVDAYLERDRAQGLDVREPPVARFALFQVADDRYRVVWTCHHILLDGWSSQLVVNEVLARYRAKEGNRPWARRSAISYGDYRKQLAKFGQQLVFDHWREQLKGCSPMV